jgi:hypothetical protein
LLDGESICFVNNDKKEMIDTLYHFVFKKGLIVKDKYGDAFDTAKKRYQFIIDSLKKVHIVQNKKRIAYLKVQHNLYKAKKSKVWERDTIRIYTYSDGAGVVKDSRPYFTWKQAIFEQKNNTDSSIIDVKAGTNTNDADITFSYVKNTLKLQGKGFIYGTTFHNSYYFDIKTPPDTIKIVDYYIEYALLNDSVVQYTWHYDNEKLREIRIDSVLTKYSFPKGVKPKVVCDYKVKDGRKGILNALNNQDKGVIPINPLVIDIQLDVPVLKSTISFFYDDNEKLYLSKQGQKLVQYKPDGSIDTTMHTNEKGKYVGYLKTKCRDTLFTTYYNMEGEKNGLQTAYIINDKNDTLLVKKNYYIQDTLHNYTIQTFDTNIYLRNKICTDKECHNWKIAINTYDRNSEIVYNIIMRDDTVLYATGFYIKDAKIKLPFLILERQEGNVYTYNSWYENGQPMYKNSIVDMRMVFADINRFSDFIHSDFTENGQSFFATAFKYHENGALAEQVGLRTDLSKFFEVGGICYESSLSLKTAYYNDGLIAIEHLTNDIEFRYPDFNSKETCIWAKLPIQQGKFRQGYRVGKWRGFERTAEKKLIYEINYNDDGLVDGNVILYNKDGAIKIKSKYKNGVLDGQTMELNSDTTYMLTNYKMGSILTQKTYLKDSILSKISYFEGYCAKKDTFFDIKKDFFIATLYNDTYAYSVTKTKISTLKPIISTERGKTSDYDDKGRIRFINDLPNYMQTTIDTNGIAKSVFINNEYTILNSKPKPIQYKKRYFTLPNEMIKVKIPNEIGSLDSIANDVIFDYETHENKVYTKKINTTASLPNYVLPLTKCVFWDKKGGKMTVESFGNEPMYANIRKEKRATNDANEFKIKSYRKMVGKAMFIPKIKYITPKRAIKTCIFAIWNSSPLIILTYLLLTSLN